MKKRSREVLRRAVFDAMRTRSENAENSGADQLMFTLVEFYHPYPSNEELITLDNATPAEIETATNFFIEIFDLKKCNLELDSPDYVRSLRHDFGCRLLFIN
ncbi:hypothetical protein PRIPAC_94022 [Pristionchus pacificus]|uniref:Uncharacterized protein n=1 Tax=Pristionchus pacificus TaxID=54126 RepID=A0A2A6CDD7_PRIPA|nr:hypothetical protein PRIPAC_94022 [Pristionchus pacificus]|eukprot:PDM76119.1 hypothetical protein PRIPAC_39723 [Pristionchus pacificus]